MDNTAKMREEQCKIMDMPTIEIVDYLEKYGAENDLPNKIRMMIDQLKLRLENGEDEDLDYDGELTADYDEIDLLSMLGESHLRSEAKLNAIQAYAVGMNDATGIMASFVNNLIDSDDDEDES